MALDRKTAEQIYDSGKEPTVNWMLQIDAKVDDLIEKVARLTKNSSNSSKPPSSDIVKPTNSQTKEQDKRKNRKGGQLNHPKWERTLFGPDEVNPIEYQLTSCPHCHSHVRPMVDEKHRILQQIGLSTQMLEITEHRADAFWCPRCQKVHYAQLPEPAVKQGLFKPDLAAMVCFLKYVGCMSLSGIKKFLHDFAGVKVAKSYLAKVLRKGAQALNCCYDELLQALPSQPVVNSDETGHKENGEGFWTWAFRSSMFVLFKISPSRGSEVLIDVLGKEFNGALGCDYFSAYRKFMSDFNVKIQFCLAHLIREVKFLVDFPDPCVKRYGTKILNALRELFHTIHDRDTFSLEQFARRLEECKKAVLKAGTDYVPLRKEAQNMAKRMRENGHSYFTFITTPDIDPTNNCAEQAIRFVVIYRKVSQGTRSENGRKACERFFTVIATCARQGRSAYQFIKKSIECFTNGMPGPSLLPNVPSG